jgi:hypothetical protein
VLRTAQHGNETVRYIEATLDDIALANRLAHDVLGRTLDELPPQTRRLLKLVVSMVEAQCAEHEIRRSDYRFSRRQVREHTRWGDTQLKIHLGRLVELEYLLVHRGGRGQSFEYELLYDGAVDGTTPRLSGLIDVEALRCMYDTQRSGSDGSQSASGRGAVGTLSAAGRLDAEHDSADKSSTSRESVAATSKMNGTRAEPAPSSYLHPSLAASSA